MRVALIEPYHGGSHAAWADGYAAHSRHDVSVVAHPARFWKWRMHGSFLTLAELLAADVSTHGKPDVLLVSSMTDVAAFAGAIRHMTPGVPIASYFHESQFSYPLSTLDRPDATYPMKNWSSAVVSDLVIFNSMFHKETFREQVSRFLSAFPEYRHVHRVDEVIDAALVLPVGVDLAMLARARRVQVAPSPLIVWNHLWEHDKGPDSLMDVVAGLLSSGVDFSMAMCGEVFVSVPPAFSAVTDALGDHLIHGGWAARTRYVELLLGASVVLSTSLQEFFGVGVVEGIAAGAVPVLPDRLVYPERVAELGIDPKTVLYRTAEEAVDRILAALAVGAPPAIRESALRYDWSVVAPQYDRILADLASCM